MRELQVVDAGELTAVYADADYAVVLDGDALQLRVGERALDLEAYWPAQRYAFITAWNPASVPHSEAANETANASLVARLDAIGVARQPAHAFDRDGRWREAGWLVADLEDSLLDLLAREFGQAGVLAWALGKPVRLRMQLPKPDHLDVASCAVADWIDWVAVVDLAGHSTPAIA
jgi:hypothetical protein